MIREKAPIFLEISKNLGDLCATPPSTIINRNERLHIAVFVKMPDIYIYPVPFRLGAYPPHFIVEPVPAPGIPGDLTRECISPLEPIGHKPSSSGCSLHIIATSCGCSDWIPTPGPRQHSVHVYGSLLLPKSRRKVVL